MVHHRSAHRYHYWHSLHGQDPAMGSFECRCFWIRHCGWISWGVVMKKIFVLAICFLLIVVGTTLFMGQAGPAVSKQTPLTVSGDRTRFTDRSGTIAVGGSSQTLVAANQLRKR